MKITKRKSPQARNVIAFSILIMVLFSMAVAYQASRAYENAIANGESSATRLTRSLSSHVELAFIAVDLTLRRVNERQYFNELFGGKLPKDMENNFRLWVNETPQISALFMTNESGKITMSASTQDYADMFAMEPSVAGYEFFSSTKDGNDLELNISSFTDDDGHAKAIIVSRKAHHINGEFAGIVFAVLNPDYFIRYFLSIETGAHSFMSLHLESGDELVAGPQYKDVVREVSELIFSESEQPVSSIIETKQTQHLDRIKIFSYRHLNWLPIIVSVTIDEEDFLSSWREARMKDVGFLAMFAIFGSVLSYFSLAMLRQIRRVEESEQAAIMASQAKSEFLANMSHELRTPLNAIIGFSEMMDAGYFGALPEKQKERIHDINLCGNHLLQLINDILEFSKGDAGKMELSEEAFDLSQVVDECVRISGQRARNKDIKIETKVAKNIPTFFGDRRKIRQLLLNLITNATKFTDEGGSITINAHMDSQSGMVMEIIDTGIGMDSSDIPIALAVFGQVHRATHPEGTGLGLPLCRMFMELHGGTLNMESEKGKGTKIKLFFPASRIHPDARMVA